MRIQVIAFQAQVAGSLTHRKGGIEPHFARTLVDARRPSIPGKAGAHAAAACWIPADAQLLHARRGDFDDLDVKQNHAIPTNLARKVDDIRVA